MENAIPAYPVNCSKKTFGNNPQIGLSRLVIIYLGGYKKCRLTQLK